VPSVEVVDHEDAIDERRDSLQRRVDQRLFVVAQARRLATLLPSSTTPYRADRRSACTRVDDDRHDRAEDQPDQCADQRRAGGSAPTPLRAARS
jgi:hypothetical protein